MDMIGRRWGGLALAAALGLAACHHPAGAPTGDVVARVDGEDITSNEIEAEAKARGVSLTGPNAAAARDALLTSIVERTLLVGEARKRGLDHDPAIEAQRWRADAEILARAALQPVLAERQPISDRQVAQFEAANPQMFGDRKALHIDQIQFPTDAAQLPDGGREQMTDVLGQLTALNVHYDRSEPTIDSATVPANLVSALEKEPGRPIRVNNGGTSYFITLLDAKPLAIDKEAARKLAERAIATRDAQARVADKIAALRKAGKIEYQPGYAPTKKAS